MLSSISILFSPLRQNGVLALRYFLNVSPKSYRIKIDIDPSLFAPAGGRWIPLVWSRITEQARWFVAYVEYRATSVLCARCPGRRPYTHADFRPRLASVSGLLYQTTSGLTVFSNCCRGVWPRFPRWAYLRVQLITQVLTNTGRYLYWLV